MSRKDDQTVKEREHALQSLDLAYHKYKEIVRHLDEGLKVSDSVLHVPARLTWLSISVLQRPRGYPHAVQGQLQGMA